MKITHITESTDLRSVVYGDTMGKQYTVKLTNKTTGAYIYSHTDQPDARKGQLLTNVIQRNFPRFEIFKNLDGLTGDDLLGKLDYETIDRDDESEEDLLGATLDKALTPAELRGVVGDYLRSNNIEYRSKTKEIQDLMQNGQFKTGQDAIDGALKILGHKNESTLEQKVQQMKELVERAKHVRANSKKPKIVKPNTGHESPHPYDNAGFVGEESVELNENPLLAALPVVLRGLAGQGWKYGAQAGARGATKFTGTKMGQRAAQKVGADTIKKVGVAGGKIAGGTAGLAADAYLLDKLVDQFGQNEVTNALRQAQGGKQQMFTDMLNKAIQTGIISTDELDSAMGMYENLDEVSMQDIKKGAQVAAVTGAIALGGAGIGKVSDYMDQGAFDYSIQLPQLEMYLDYAEAQKDQRMIKQLKTRIRNHEGRLSMGKGDVDGRDGTPLTFEVVYDKENPNFDPLGDPMQLNKKFKDARDNMPEGKSPHKKGTAKYKKHMAAMHAEGKKKPELPKQNNPVAKHSRNKSGAGAHVDKKKEAKKRGDFSPLDEAQYSADKAALLSAVLHELESEVLNADNTKMLRRLARLIGKKVFRRDNGSLTLEDKE